MVYIAQEGGRDMALDFGVNVDVMSRSALIGGSAGYIAQDATVDLTDPSV
jgi:hypothetical protein